MQGMNSEFDYASYIHDVDGLLHRLVHWCLPGPFQTKVYIYLQRAAYAGTNAAMQISPVRWALGFMTPYMLCALIALPCRA